MKLSSLLHANHIVPNLEAHTLEEAIHEVLRRAEGFRPGTSPQEICEAVLRREAQGSTAASDGVALPHARIPSLRDFFIILGLPRSPLEDRGLDGRPVDMVFLILSNDKKNTLMLQTMAAIGSLSRDTGLLAAVREGADRETIWRLIDDSGITVKKALQARDLMRDCEVRAFVTMPLRDALDLMAEGKVSEVPVLSEDDRIIGAVTSEEVIEAGFPRYMSRLHDVAFLNEFEPFEQFFKREVETTVGEMMNPDPLVVDVDDPMIQVVFRMKQERQRFAFVEENGRLAGIIDRNDIISRILRA